MPGGRPAHFDDPAEFRKQVERYFEEITRPPTLAGLAYFLGFADRHSLHDYAKRPEYSATVSRARLRIEQDRAERLILKEEYTPGLPMDLRVNHGWEDPQKHEVSGRDGKPIATMDLSRLTEDQLSILEKAVGLFAEPEGSEGGEGEAESEEGA